MIVKLEWCFLVIYKWPTALYSLLQYKCPLARHNCWTQSFWCRPYTSPDSLNPDICVLTAVKDGCKSLWTTWQPKSYTFFFSWPQVYTYYRAVVSIWAPFLRKLDLLKLEQLPSLQTDIITEKSISMVIVITSGSKKGREITFIQPVCE